MPTVSLTVTKHQKDQLVQQAEAAGLTLNKMLQDKVLNGQARDLAFEANQKQIKEVIMANQDNCPGCIKSSFDLELKTRDLTEAKEETQYWQQQAQKANEELQRVTNLAKQAEARANADRHSSIKEILECPTCGARAAEELPKAVDKKQALHIARLHVPELFEPVKLKIK